MDLYLIRHAEAAPLGEGGITDDADRPLTEKGHEQAHVVAAGLRKYGVHLGTLVTSPLLRARQTAQNLLQHGPEPAPTLEVREELAPGHKRRRLTKYLLQLDAEAIGLVGHNPDLSELVGWLIGDRKVGIDLAKAGVACVHFPEKAGKGLGTLAWLVPPEWFRDGKTTGRR
jgi:phosphohistidine phosphatase